MVIEFFIRINLSFFNTIISKKEFGIVSINDFYTPTLTYLVNNIYLHNQKFYELITNNTSYIPYLPTFIKYIDKLNIKYLQHFQFVVNLTFEKHLFI